MARTKQNVRKSGVVEEEVEEEEEEEEKEEEKEEENHEEDKRKAIETIKNLINNPSPQYGVEFIQHLQSTKLHLIMRIDSCFTNQDPKKRIREFIETEFNTFERDSIASQEDSQDVLIRLNRILEGLPKAEKDMEEQALEREKQVHQRIAKERADKATRELEELAKEEEENRRILRENARDIRRRTNETPPQSPTVNENCDFVGCTFPRCKKPPMHRTTRAQPTVKIITEEYKNWKKKHTEKGLEFNPHRKR